MTTLYETLGVPPDAKPATVKAAWRRRSQATHPDKSNGNAEEFNRIQKAYNVLSDPLKRAEYDATGRVGEAPPLRDHALQMLEEVVAKLMDSEVDTDFDNIIVEMETFINGQHTQVLMSQTQTHQQIKKRQKALKRLKRKQGEGLLETLLQGQIDRLEGVKKKQQHHLDVFKEGLAILKDYTYEADTRPPQQIFDMRTTRGTSTGFFGSY